MKAYRNQFIVAIGGALILTAGLGVLWHAVWWLLLIFLPPALLGVYDMLQKKHTLLRIYPVIGHVRFLFEAIRPEIQQYFVESDLNGRPVSREYRSLVYQRAKHARDTRPFGTQFDVYRSGYEWANHSLAPKSTPPVENRVLFGGAACRQPYAASHLNISAMSFGALSRTAILALNKGAKAGGFAHNTGEGGISPYHLQGGADLIWQIGTGYFGCRTLDGAFDPALFAENAARDVVKMVEIKLSQGAKPGHGGILPAGKVSPEIAAIRHVPLGQDVISPPSHSMFSTPVGLLEFVAQLRELSGGKPVGFKLCIGYPAEFFAICKAMLATGITPDFITIDGGEGGTGAAPIEFTNSVGTPLRDGLILVHNALRGVGLRKDIRLIASGKILSAFHMFRVLALGADTINVARAMMFALGCIQARRCDSNTCPTGIATQNPIYYKALDVPQKAERVAHYHAEMIRNLLELVAIAGLDSPEDIRPQHVYRRVSNEATKTYADIYPMIPEGALLNDADDVLPPTMRSDWQRADATCWQM